MPYDTLSQANAAIRGIDPPVTLEQADAIAAMADALEAEGVEQAWAIAIKRFKDSHEAREGRWVKREANMPEVVEEAATYKAAAMRMARDMEVLLKDRTVPESLRKEVEDVRAALRKTWAALEADGKPEEPAEEPEGAEEEEPEESEEESSTFNWNLLERTYVTLPDRRRIAMADCVRAWQRLQEAVTKTVDGVEHPASHFLVVEDPEAPSTWHLPVYGVDGKLDKRLLGAAKAALTVGYRGNKYEGPGKAEALKKLKALYEEQEMQWEAASEPEPEFAEGWRERVLTAIQAALANLPDGGNDGNGGNGQSPQAETDTPTNTQEEPDKSLAEAEIELETEAELREAAIAEPRIGYAVELSEATGTWDGHSPLKLNVVLIEPGAGNAHDNHYYPREVIQRDGHVFEGGKMFATDHRPEQKSVLTEVADILKCPVGFTETGGLVAQVGIFDPAFAQKVWNRYQLGTLRNLHASIVGFGKTRPGRVNGQTCNVVQEIINGSADFVTQAGAGGHAQSLAEADREEGMEKGAIIEYLDGVKGVPKAVLTRLQEQAFESKEAIDEAIQREMTYIREATGAGEVTGQAEVAQRPRSGRTAEEHNAAIAELYKSYGLRVA